MSHNRKLAALNDPPKLLHGPQLLHKLIHWTGHSDECALYFSSNGQIFQYTYAELWSNVQTLVSQILETLKTTSDANSEFSQHVIPILLPQSPGLYISQLAILESGGAFCPIVLDAPQDRIKFVAGDVSARIIITTRDLKEKVSWDNGPQVIVIDDFPLHSDQVSTPGTIQEPRPSDLAYVMYTSGSSGMPKGVAVSHLAASQSLLAHQQHIPKFKRFLQFAAPSFDVSVFEIFFPLVRGATLVGCTRELLLNDLPGTITALDVDAAELTPTVAGSLLQKRANAPCLRVLLTIGEMLTRPIIEEFGGSKDRESMLFGMYGPTEAAIHCNINPRMACTSSPSNIGIPLETVSNFVAAPAEGISDAQILKFLPEGEIGELVLGGPQLARGYLNRDEQNKAAFITSENEFYYRTGDKAKILPDGTVEIYGRISAGQIKLRGQRVELGEIENAVYEHPGVRTAVAAVLGTVLVVFVLVNDAAIDGKGILDTCSKWLPKYMTPSEVILYEELPHLASGKVDKKKLLLDYQQSIKALNDNENSLTSRTAVDVRSVLEDTLGSAYSSTRLAASGLDSLSSIRISSKLRSLGYAVDTLAILQCDTVQSMAKLCNESKATEIENHNTSSNEALEYKALSQKPENAEEVLPCTPLQSSMLAETSIKPDAYWNQIELEVRGTKDVKTLWDGIKSLASHNSILRTGFLESDNTSGYDQVIWKDLPDFAIEVVKHVDISRQRESRNLQHPIKFLIQSPDNGFRLHIFIHHALYDAWSLELLLDDFNSILLCNTPPARPAFGKLVTSHFDGSLLKDESSSKGYWRDHLLDLETRGLPNFQTKASLSTGLVVESLHTQLPTTTIENAARRMQSSPQSIFQAAYSLLLSSYLGTADVCFGTVFSNRTLPVPGIEDIAGPCLATLPIRLDVSQHSRVQDLVQDFNSLNRKHMAHSALPLIDIKSAARIEPRQALFDTLLLWQQTLHKYDHERERFRILSSVDDLEFNLTLEVIPRLGNIELKANYQQFLIPTSQIKLMLSQLENIVRIIVENESLTLDEVCSHLPKDLLSIENPHPDLELRSETLSSPVERFAKEDPKRLAISFASSIEPESVKCEEINYGELNRRGNQLGNYLVDSGVLPDQLVCICLEKSIDLYMSILSVAKIGAGYLPVTPDTPIDRLQHILREANVRVLIVNSSSRHLFKDLEGLKIVDLDVIDFSMFSVDDLLSRYSPKSISYCVFTSGSTGTPKGVLVSQGNLLSNLDVLEELYPSTEYTRLLQSCSQAFDVSVFEIFFTWRVGGCLCAATKDVLFRDIELAIRVLKVTHLSLTPTVAALIDPENVPDVEFLVTAGEAVTQKVFNAWADRGLYQGYGPSETTNICTVNPRVARDDSINNIGAPFSNTSAFVLRPGDDFSVVPKGGEGEFCFGGAQVFYGYLNKQQESGKIIEHPEYGRLYRSGDYGRIMPDGTLIFTGRKDDQVKIRGQRVELGEINNILLNQDEVRDCVTVTIQEQNQQQILVSFWSIASEESSIFQLVEPDRDILQELFEKLEAALPAYMIPSSLIPVSRLPSTTQGKIDKRLLASQYMSLSLEYRSRTSYSSGASTDHSWTELEISIAQVITELTNTPLSQITPDMSFFTLGIDSISAITVARNISTKIKQEVLISDVLKHSSVLRLAKKISSSTHDTTHQASVSGDFDSKFDPDFLEPIVGPFRESGNAVSMVLPCTPLQVSMLSAADASSEKLYSNEVKLKITGDAQKLEKCWIQMTNRHEILRTCFVETDHPDFPYVQAILDKVEFDVPKGGLQVPYSIRFETIGEENYVSIAMSHALYDGVALEILYHEVERLYGQETLPPAISMQPFINEMLKLNYSEADTFWAGVLKSFKATRLSDDSTRPKNLKDDQPISQVQRRIIATPLATIDTNIKKYATTLLAVCHTVWSSLLAERIQATDVCFGNVVSGRSLPVEGIERLVAPCFNTVPVRLSNIHKSTYLEAFRSFQSLNADILPFQFMPLRRLQSKFSPDGLRLFDTLFILQQSAKELDPSIWITEEDDGVMDFPLVIEIVPRKNVDALELILHSYTSFFSPDETNRLLESFENILGSLLENPRRQMLSALVRDQIMKKQESRDLDSGRTAQAEVSPTQVLSSLEMQIRDIFKDFTDIPVKSIGKDVSIFRLGLDSISTVQIATCLRKQGYAVLGSDILAHPSISQLASFIKARKTVADQITFKFDFDAFDQKHRASICAAYGLPNEQIETIRPCTAVQKGMLAQTLHSGGQDYVNSIWLKLGFELSLQDFKAAWRVACSKHEMLRTIFAQVEEFEHSFAMVTFTAGSFDLPWYDTPVTLANSSTSAEDIFRRPWSLIVQEEGGEVLIQFKAHHALYDGQSVKAILSDVGRSCIGMESEPSQPITPILGAILASNESMQQEKKAFWQKDENKIIVSRFPDLTPLRIHDINHEVCQISSRSSLENLEGRCRELGVTMQSAAQVAWARILASYTGEVSTTFGMTLSGRSVHEDAQSGTFPTLVTLPVRCDIAGSNAEALERTMSSNTLLHHHQFTQLTSIQKWAGYPEGRMFDTLFAYQKLGSDDDNIVSPWTITREEAFADYAVSMEVLPESTGEITLRLTFRTNLIPVKHAKLLLQQYDAFLHDTLNHPNADCSLAIGFNNGLMSITPAHHNSLPGPITLLHEFVTRGAQEWPNKIALEFATSLEPGNFKRKTWTYQQLDLESNSVANLLLKNGTLPGQLVGICFDKCAEASFAIIGIMKAGCAYVALDPTAPIDRLKYISEDSKSEIILTAGSPGQKIKGKINARIIMLDDPQSITRFSVSSPNLSTEITPQDTSYCLYTSGTTGTPKGCLITHENAVQAMYAFQILFAKRWTPESKWLQFASFHFDVSVLEQFWSWSVGICVASAPRDLIFEDIPGAIRQLGITHIDLTPSLARLLHPDDVPSLINGVFITGGEPLKQEILDVWGQHSCVYNGYGPTEATIGVTMYPRVPKNGTPSNIGPAFENVGSFVLKPGTQIPVLRGGVGELCVSGKLVGKGYLNRPELTNERFPTLKDYDERVYRTGDLVRILLDGSFIFLGRADDQVKLRGQRLELSEINEVMKKSAAGVDEVVTLVLKHMVQQKEQLVTFFVISAHPSSVNISSRISILKDTCKSRLPGYMVPTHFIEISKMPLNANNKADSKQLAAMYNNMSVTELQNISHSSHRTMGWSEKEASVVVIIARVLGVEVASINRGSNIFELGIDSISIIGFSRSLRNSGLDLAKLSTVKRSPLVEELVEALLEDTPMTNNRENSYYAAKQTIAAFSQKHLITICSELEVQSFDVEAIAPCTAVQEGLIYRYLESDATLYFNEFEFQVEVNVGELRLAWSQVIDTLQIMRTKFVETEDGYAQVVLRPTNSHDPREHLDLMTRDKAAALKQPFQLALSARPVGGTMNLRIFHGLYDGNSFMRLLRCVVDEFRHSKDIHYGPAFHEALPYGPLAQVRGAQDFWSQHLQGWAHSPPAVSQASTVDVTATYECNQLEGVERLRKDLAVSHQAIFQAAWISVLQDLTSPQLTLGVVTSGRALDLEDAENVIGPLFNTLPFNITLSPGSTTKDLITECHKFNMAIHDFQHTPLKDIQKWSPANPGESLFDCLFVFQRLEEIDEGYFDNVWTLIEDEQVADYPLALEASLSPDYRSLKLTLVAQGTYLTESESKNLLIKLADAIEEILRTGGENVLVIENSQVNAKTRGQLEVSKPTSENQQFTWTQQALQIRAELSELSKLPESSITENSSVFELGLDSIEVIKLSSRIKKLGFILTVGNIIKAQNISGMLSKITIPDKQKPSESDIVMIDQMRLQLYDYFAPMHDLHDMEDILPATPLQQSMVNEMIRSSYKRYFNVEVFKLSSTIDAEKLRHALEIVIEGSPILRTAFLEVEDPAIPVSYAQIVYKNASDHVMSIIDSELPLLNEDFDSYPNQFRRQATRKAQFKNMNFQAQFFKHSREKYICFAVSHALYDGSSLRALHEDIRKTYNMSFVPRPDFKPFLETALRSITEEAKTFWKSTLSSIPCTSFPRRKPKGPERVERLEITSRTSLTSVESLCRSFKITLQTLGQTCWALALANLTGQLDVLFGSVLSCRDSEEANEVMFPLMNTVAIRSIVHGTVEQLLKHMQSMSDKTREFQHFPLSTAQTYAISLMAERGLAKDTTLFDTLFIYQGRRLTAREEPLYESVYSISDVEFPVCVEMEVVDDQNLTWTTACKNVVDIEASQVLELLEAILERFISQPDSQVMDTNLDGISICGLPCFRLSNETKIIRQAKIDVKPDEVDDIWSETEIHFRHALHELSRAPEDTIKKDTTIFDLGLDSILILKLPALLRDGGIKIPVSGILKGQSARGMAAIAISTSSKLSDKVDVDSVIRQAISNVDIEPYRLDLERNAGLIKEVLPATAGQLFMIRQWQSSRGILFYPTFTFAIAGRIHKARLDRAWRRLTSRHEILRTGFLEVQARFLQLVYMAPHNDVIYRKIGSPPIRRHDLTYPPANLILEEGDYVTELKLVIHHALYDGISLPKILRDLEQFYADETLQPVEFTYRDFVARSFATGSSADARQKWVDYLNTEEVMDEATNSSASADNERTEIFHPSNPTPNIRSKAQSFGVSIDALLLAMISRVRAGALRSNSGRGTVPYVVIGIYHSNRAPFALDFSTLSAPTLTLLPIIIRNPLDQELKEIAKSVQQDLQMIGEGGMASATLEDIYKWTGKRVGFWVNILKDSVDEDTGVDATRLLIPQNDVRIERARIVQETPNLRVFAGNQEKLEAYLPSIDVEIRYNTSIAEQGGVDIGVFAPSRKLDLVGAENLVREIIEELQRI